MANLPVLEFSPVFKETVWGGRKLEEVLGKKLPGEGPFGESWEVVDLPSDQSVTADGRTLEALCAEAPASLLGGAPLLDGRFPLLFKYIDAGQTLSVQVHPDEAACARIGDGARPKTEAWYIIDREPGASLYVGLIPGVDKQTFASAIMSGEVDALLNEVPVEPGDLIYLPSGTIHAIGEGILLAEVQQSSNTTYRVFDWNRLGLDGNPRDLHVGQALESIHFNESGIPPIDSPPSGRKGIHCRDFTMELLDLQAGEEAILEGEGPLVTMGMTGEQAGKTLLYPDSLATTVHIKASAETTILSTRIPVR